MDYSITSGAGISGSSVGRAGDTQSHTNGGGFLSALGQTFNGALDQTLRYGLPQWLDYDYMPNAPGNGQWTNQSPQDLSGWDPQFLNNVRGSGGATNGTARPLRGDTGLYIAAGVALLGVIVLLK